MEFVALLRSPRRAFKRALHRHGPMSHHAMCLSRFRSSHEFDSRRNPRNLSGIWLFAHRRLLRLAYQDRARLRVMCLIAAKLTGLVSCTIVLVRFDPRFDTSTLFPTHAIAVMFTCSRHTPAPQKFAFTTGMCLDLKTTFDNLFVLLLPPFPSYTTHLSYNGCIFPGMARRTSCQWHFMSGLSGGSLLLCLSAVF